MTIIPSLNSAQAIRTAALQNPGLFTAAYAKAPVSVTYKGKSYLRAAAQTVEQKIAYLAMVGMVSPSLIGKIGQGALYLDNSEFMLDPDRSAVQAAQSAVRDAERVKREAQATLNARTAELRTYEANERAAAARLKDADRVQGVGDVFSFGISVAARVAYEKGQVQLWKDCQQAIQTGAVVGMCGQVKPDQEWQGKGILQARQALQAANAAVSSARAELADAQRAYNEEARAMRRAEEESRREAARDEAERRREEIAAAKRDSQAQVIADRQSQQVAAYAAPDAPYEPNSVTTDDGEVWTGEEAPAWADDDAGDFVETYGHNAELAEAMGVDLGPDEVAEIAGISPWSFDRYYADAEVEQVFGADTQIVPIILAAILALAPIILSIFAPPPEVRKDAATAADNVALIAAGVGGAVGPPAEKPANTLSDEQLAAATAKQRDQTGALLLLGALAYVALGE